MFATADIAPQEEIASIPLDLVLTHQRADDSPVGAAVRELNNRLQSATSPHPAVLISPRTTLYLYMIQQLADPAAFFHPYLASLSPPCTPLLWPPPLSTHLAGTNLHAAIPNKLRQLHTRYTTASHCCARSTRQCSLVVQRCSVLSGLCGRTVSDVAWVSGAGWRAGGGGKGDGG